MSADAVAIDADMVVLVASPDGERRPIEALLRFEAGREDAGVVPAVGNLGEAQFAFKAQILGVEIPNLAASAPCADAVSVNQILAPEGLPIIGDIAVVDLELRTEAVGG